MEDEKIVELYWERKESAVAETQSKYGRHLYKVAYTILSNAQDAEECVNDTYFAAWNNIPPTRPKHLMAYLSKISEHAAINRVKYYNAGKRRAWTEQLGDKLYCLEAFREEMEVKEESKVIVKIINEFITSLNEEKSAIFVRRFRDDISIKSIADEFNFTESKVKMMLARMRLALKDCLEKAEVYL